MINFWSKNICFTWNLWEKGFPANICQVSEKEIYTIQNSILCFSFVIGIKFRIALINLLNRIILLHSLKNKTNNSIFHCYNNKNNNNNGYNKAKILNINLITRIITIIQILLDIKINIINIAKINWRANLNNNKKNKKKHLKLKRMKIKIIQILNNT